MKKACYAVYKGDTFIDLGTSEELSKKLKVNPETVRFWATPTNKKRAKKKDSERIIAIKIEEGE